MAAPRSPALKPSLAETGRRDSSSSVSKLSHGRGGAGNMGAPKNIPNLNPEDFETPTLKGSMYTTGRGGSGNMAKNDDPLEARRAQDVVGKPRRESGGAARVGRGGAANVFKPTPEEIEKAKRDNEQWGESAIGDETEGRNVRDKDSRGLAEKGKDALAGLLGRK